MSGAEHAQDFQPESRIVASGQPRTRLLLAESISSRWRQPLTDHSVRVVAESGWFGVKRGKLLALAAVEFDAFIAVE